MSKSAFYTQAAAARSIARISFCIVMLAICFGIVSGASAPVFATPPPQGSDADWTYADHDFNGTRYSPLKQITPASLLTRS